MAQYLSSTFMICVSYLTGGDPFVVGPPIVIVRLAWRQFNRAASRRRTFMGIHLPPTVIVRHQRENRKKCSIWPLHGRPDLVFLPYPVRERPDLTGYIRLAAEGPELSPADAAAGVLLLDGSWRWAAAMTRAFLDVPPRSLHGFRTAYPRVSKQGTDPDNGLASVEALYVAYHILGRETQGLLDHYRWAEEFLRINQLGGTA